MELLIQKMNCYEFEPGLISILKSPNCFCSEPILDSFCFRIVQGVLHRNWFWIGTEFLQRFLTHGSGLRHYQRMESKCLMKCKVIALIYEEMEDDLKCESEGSPKDDPLMLWLTGGPGCSGLSALLYEIGPFTINYENSTLEKTMLEINPHSWTKVANIIFLDQPAGTGFSYAKTPEAYITNDTLSTTYTYHFLRKWLVEHPKFLNNPMYIGADSYAGIMVPMIVEKIYNGNEVGEQPEINIKGYVLGNPLTDRSGDFKSRIPFAHRTALLSDEIYKSTKTNCLGKYLNVDPNNTLCINDLQVVAKDDNRQYSNIWANSREVREALHIREELKDIEWVPCNDTMHFHYDKEAVSYTHNMLSVVTYHRYLSNKNCRALIYSGDHDMVVPYMGTLNSIESLNLLEVNGWTPWFVDKQVAGYTVKYSKHNYTLTFATLKVRYRPQRLLLRRCSSHY
ncbi:hypothetical protein LXL04_029174 [Taraxacum kok-saghyz]